MRAEINAAMTHARQAQLLRRIGGGLRTVAVCRARVCIMCVRYAALIRLKTRAGPLETCVGGGGRPGPGAPPRQNGPTRAMTFAKSTAAYAPA